MRFNLKRANALTQVTDVALADFDGFEELQIDDMMSASAALNFVMRGQASAGRRNCGLAPLTRLVQVLSLDSAIRRFSLPPPNVIKIDVAVRKPACYGAPGLRCQVFRRGSSWNFMALTALEKPSPS